MSRRNKKPRSEQKLMVNPSITLVSISQFRRESAMFMIAVVGVAYYHAFNRHVFQDENMDVKIQIDGPISNRKHNKTLREWGIEKNYRKILEPLINIAAEMNDFHMVKILMAAAPMLNIQNSHEKLAHECFKSSEIKKSQSVHLKHIGLMPALQPEKPTEKCTQKALNFINSCCAII